MTLMDARPDAADIDVMTNSIYGSGVPHDLLEILRRERPIHHQRIPDERLYDEAWVLTKYEHVMEVSKNTDDFINGHGLNLRSSYSDDEDRHLLNVDDPEHLRLRRMTNKGFTPKVVRRYTEHYGDLSGQLLDEALALGSVVDVVESLAVPLPLMAICELLGTTPDDRERLIAWSNAVITNDDPDYSPSEEHRFEALLEMRDYAIDILRSRQAEPRDDIATMLANQLAQGELTEDEYCGYVTLLFVAGNETTRNAISHGLLQMALNPAQYELLRTGDYFDTAVEEMIRWASPVIYMSRTVTRDRDFHGHALRTGDKVVLHYASANRDEDVFTNGMNFDLTRDPNPHIAFGFGAHFCLGVHLARLEIKCLLQELVKRVPSFELAEPEAYVQSSFINGVKNLKVRVGT